MFFINHREIEDGKAAIVEIEGPLNSESSPDFEDYIKKLLENDIIYILIDFRKLSFISSEGIGAALMLHKRIAGRNGAAIFCNLNSEVTGLFRILGFNRIFTIAETISEALDMIEDKIGFSGPGSMNFGEEFVSDTGTAKDEIYPLPEPELKEFDEPDLFNENFELVDDETMEPFVIECMKCGSLVRVKEKGDHVCPFCNTGFTVSGDGRAFFKIDEGL